MNKLGSLTSKHICNVITENILQRVVSTLKFGVVFVKSLLDDLTQGLNSFCKEGLDISKVLRFERALLNQQLKKVRGKDGELMMVYSRLGLSFSLNTIHRFFMILNSIYLTLRYFYLSNICDTERESVSQFYANIYRI